MQQFFWAFIGALLSLLLYIGYESALVLRRSTLSLFATWQSSWQPTFDTGWDWIVEEVTICHRFGRILLSSKNNSRGYEWRGKARLFEDRFLVGDWRSTKADSYTAGTFILTFGFDGGYMIGYFFGPDTGSSKIISAFVLGRTLQDVERGKERLQSAAVVYCERAQTIHASA
jgi:hypothetical protein